MRIAYYTAASAGAVCVAALVGTAAFLNSAPVHAAVAADRFGGFEDAACYGEGAGKAAPAASDVYEALAVGQAPQGTKGGPEGTLSSGQDDTGNADAEPHRPDVTDTLEPGEGGTYKIIRIVRHVCHIQPHAAGKPAPIRPEQREQPASAVPTGIWLHVGPGSISYSLPDQRASSVGGGALAQDGALRTCAQRNQAVFGEFKLSAPLPAGWWARARDNYRTFCTIQTGSNYCSFTFNLGDGDTFIGEISDPKKGNSIAAVGLKATDDGQCHD